MDCPHYFSTAYFSDTLAKTTAAAVRRAAAAKGCVSCPAGCLEEVRGTEGGTLFICDCPICCRSDKDTSMHTTDNVNALGSDATCSCSCPHFCGAGDVDPSFSNPAVEFPPSIICGQCRLCQSKGCCCSICPQDCLCENACEPTVVADVGGCSCATVAHVAAAAPPLVELESSAAAEAIGNLSGNDDGSGTLVSSAPSLEAAVGGGKTPEPSDVSAATTSSRCRTGPRPENTVTSDARQCRGGTVGGCSRFQPSSGNLHLARSSTFSGTVRKDPAVDGAPVAVAHSASCIARGRSTAESAASKKVVQGSIVSADEAAAAPGSPVAPGSAASPPPRNPHLAKMPVNAGELQETAELGGVITAAAALNREAREKVCTASVNHQGDLHLRHLSAYTCQENPQAPDQGSRATHSSAFASRGLLPELSMLRQAEAEALTAAVAPQLNVQAFFEVLAEAGVALVRREEAQWWTAQLEQHERQHKAMRAQLKAKSAEAAEARRKVQSQSKTIQECTTRLLPSLKTKKALETSLATATADLEAEKETNKRLQRDKKDLCRTIDRLKEKLSRTENELALLQKQTEALQQDRLKAETRNSAYRKNLKGLGDVQNSLTEELAAERLEKKELKKLFDEKLVHIQHQQDNWKHQVDRQDSIVQRWKEMLDQERCERQGAEMQQQRLTEQLEEMQAFASDLAMQKEDISLQLRQQTEAKEKLQKEFGNRRASWC